LCSFLLLPFIFRFAENKTLYRLKYKAIDGHGREQGFKIAFKYGAIVAGETVPPGDKRFAVCKVQVRDHISSS